MPPLTRRESSRLSSGGADPSASVFHVDQILNHFEQYRRKHAAQNRDLVQANALAHTRIRELEARILELEGECAEHKLAASRQSTHVRRLEYALECVRVGWETMAQALRDGGVATPARTQERATRALPTPPGVPPSARVHLSDGLPTTRLPVSLATPLAADLIVEEEDDTTLCKPPGTPTHESDEAPRTPRVASPLRGDHCPVSVTRRRPSRRSSALWESERTVPPLEQAASPPQDSEVPLAPESHAEPEPKLLEEVPAAPEEPSEMSETPEEPSHLAPTTPRRKSAPRSRRTSVLADLAPLEELPDRTRRSRKSVNYALPKLNTKMRKPDPEPPTKRARTTPTRRSAPASPHTPPPVVPAEPALVDECVEAPAEPVEAPAEPVDAPTEPVDAPTEPVDAPTEPVDAPTEPVEAPVHATPRRPRRSRAEPVRRATPQISRQRNMPSREAPSTPFSTRPTTLFAPSRTRSAQALQQASAQNMPSWASSLLNLSSPEPPSKVRAAPLHGKENAHPPVP
ncbi:hypothetical protein MEQU1_003691 [Malassezia equina]|uniref:Shugoshin C-terminal domain-containing protein n=1 Tax=Malassezia equina TaxID=1381935 RepID=A0AAF0J0J4_9BASI|nr:hypothetical protein MEQU1_003691 [Malassezia equina]